MAKYGMIVGNESSFIRKVGTLTLRPRESGQVEYAR
jgi:hypothetical protein